MSGQGERVARTYAGIDYSLGTANRDKANGIRYGVINQHNVGQAWYDDAEAYYGKPHCPSCGNELPEGFDDGDTCECSLTIDSVGEECYPEEALSWSVDDGDVMAECGDGDIFVLKSKYFTYAAFCSPCAPGACDLMAPLGPHIVNNRAYCFGHDWYEDGKAPYPVYSVETGQLVEPDAR